MKQIFYTLFCLAALLLYSGTTSAQLSLSATTIHVSCNGGNNGSITVTPTGGTAPYSYLWAGGATTQTRTNLFTGVYSVTVTDFAGVTAVLNVAVNEPSPIFASTSVTHVTCGGGYDGAINLTVSGGVGPYAYFWQSPFNTYNTEDLSNIPAANYYYSITDANGCVRFDSANVTQPPGVIIAFTTTNVTCASGANGAINITASYGNPPFTYLWNDGVTTEDRTAIPAGTYTVTATDVIGCTGTATITVAQLGVGMSINHTSTQPSCFGGSNGSISVTTVIGSVGPYTYQWSNGASTQVNNNIAAGTYVVTATSSTGCTAEKTITIGQPTQVNVTLNVVSVSCNGGSNGAISSSISGGTAPYTFAWSDGGFSQNRTGLATGSYTVTVTDFRGCTATATAFVPQPLQLVTNAVPSPLSCTGGASGSIFTNVTGGTSPYSYWWGAGVTTPNRINVVAGTYTVTVTDLNGCTASSSATIAPYTPISTTVSQTNNLCNGGTAGSATVNVLNGLPPYLFSWSNGGSTATIAALPAGIYTVTVTDAQACQVIRTVTISQPGLPITVNSTVTDVTCFGGNNGSIALTPINGAAPYTYLWNTGATTSGITGLSAGSYSVTVTDNNGCTAQSSIPVNQFAVISLSVSSVNATCFGTASGSTSVSVTGGTAPFSYAWSSGANTINNTNVPAGNYTVTVTDNLGCYSTASVSVSQPAAMNINLTPNVINCHGAATGTINTTVTGGVLPISYLWSDGATVANRTNLTAGSYSLTVTDNTGCTQTASTLVNQLPALTVTSSVTNVACNGGNTGNINLNVTGGTSSYTFLWSDGALTQNRVNLGSGTYIVTVTDVNGCTASHTAVITQSSSITASLSVVPVNCFGQSTGIINMAVAGGVLPYTFNWSDGATQQNRNGVVAGTYTVTVTDFSGCTLAESAVVSENTQIILNENVTNIACAGLNTGAITLTVSGGSPSYSYNWGGGVTSQNRTGLAAGNYSVTVTDNALCTVSATYTVTQSANLIVNLSATPASCFGGNDGVVSSLVSGGVAPYTYNWNNAATTSSINNLTIGSYQVTVTDNAGCSGTASATVAQPAQLQVSLAPQAVSCNGLNNGSITSNVNGGTTPYSYSWSNAATTASVNSLNAASYQLTVTDAAGCTATATTLVSEPAVLQVSITKNDVLCNGSATGTVTANATGGVSPLSFNWSNGATTPSLISLSANTYQVTVSDANSCSVSASVLIVQPPQIVTSVSATAATCNSLSNGAVQLTVNGGAGGFTYNWSNGASSSNLQNVSASTFNVTITDANNCTVVASATVAEPAALQVATTPVHIGCNGNASGAVNLSVTGGTSPFSYAWSNGASSQNITNVQAGAYQATITDQNGCTTVASATVNQAAPLQVSLAPVNVTCFGLQNGSITTTVTGGNTPYQYIWNDGNTSANRSALTANSYSVTITDANACTISATATIAQPSTIQVLLNTTDVNCNGASTGAITNNVSGGNGVYNYQWNNNTTTQNLSGVQAGGYQVTVTDGANCTASAAAVIQQPAAITATLTATNITCNGNANGSIQTVVNGGQGAYSYAWSNGANTANVQSLMAGAYSLTVIDALSCTASFTTTITEPAVLTASATPTNITCFGQNNGAVTTSINGGVAPYNYSWSNNVSTANASSLAAATYTVTISDANSCSATASAQVTQPSALTVTATATDAICFGASNGTVTATVNGGTGAYTYVWSNNATTSSLTAVAAGTYTLSVTDANACVATAVSVVNQPAQIQATTTVTNVSCNGAANGSVQLSVNGGTAPYQYNWNNSNTTAQLSNLSGGTYSVTITDAANCSVTVSNVTVQEPTQLTVQGVVSPVGCAGIQDGSVATTTSGGTAPYVYSWSNNGTSPNMNNLAAGSYTITVADANGCSVTDSYIVDFTPPLTIIPVVINTACEQVANGSVEITVSGGTPAYQINWSNGNSGVMNSLLSTGNYSVTVIDSKNCSVSAAYTIAANYDLTISVTPDSEIDLGESTNLSVTSNVNNGNTYAWSPAYAVACANCETTTVAPTNTTTYNVTVTDAFGCTATGATTVIVNSITDIFIPNAFTPNNDGNNDVFQIYGDVKAIQFLDFKIFNRWGEIVFATNQHNFAWDGMYKGQMVDGGVYIYTMKVVFLNGERRNDYKGSITVIR